jgi:iron complex outermembrane receptor protein
MDRSTGWVVQGEQGNIMAVIRAASLRASLLVGASAGALLISAPAFAQPANQPPTPPADQSGTPAAKAKAAVAPPTNDQQEAQQSPPADVTVGSSGGDTSVSNQNQIVVTGTRIKQPEFTSPDPVARIDPEIAQREGKLNIADTLQSSPIAAGSTQITSAISSNFVTNGGPGAQTIDLRGLGANRTLVLLNGRRAGPAGTRGGVSSFDLNVLPQSIVKQVDILKTGASSIYGSDAIAGVVNLITKTDFNGIQVDGFANVPIGRDGGEETSASILWGKTWDRGHVMVALDFYKQRELARGDRGYLNCPEAYVFKHGSNDRADLIDPRTGKYHCEDLPVGQVWTYDYEYNYFYNYFVKHGVPPELIGNLRTAHHGELGSVSLLQYFPRGNYGLEPISGCGILSCFNSPPGWYPTGYDALSRSVQDDFNPFASEQTIIPKTSRYTLYADASYEITDGIEAYAEFLGNRRKTYQNGWRQFWTFGFTESGSYYGNYGTYWAKGWTGLNFLSPTAVTNRGSDSGQKVDYWRGVGGLRGDFGGLLKGWSYDAYVQYSHNKGIYRNEQILQDVIDLSYFQTASCVGTQTPFSHKQCRDLPWLDPSFLLGQISPDDAAYLFDWEQGKTIYKQLSGEASISGSLFNLPAGPVGVALGATARRDSIVDTPGNITLAAPNPYYDATIDPTSSECNTVFYPCQAFHGNAWGSSSSGVTAGRETTKEAFGEIQVPLLKERPFFKDLSFSGAARVTNVEAVRRRDGFTDKDTGNWTYKLGGNWAINDWLRFRGTYGTSFRAPALFEEFKADETSFPSARTIDPCVNWAFNLQQGNIDQRIADNCASQGIPPNYGGGSISATAHSEGGIGRLDPETSRAKTFSAILTPRFPFLPRTHVSLAIDYFDIEVKGEVSQLGAQNIVFGCYESDAFPTDPLCSLFDRGTQGTDPYAINNVYDRYINISSQKNRGLDFTALVQQNLGRFGTLTLLGNATYQLKDKIAVFRDVVTNNNGTIGDPKFVADLNATWKPHGGWTFFWGTDWYGKASNERLYKDRHKEAGVGTLCHTLNPSPIWGDYCVRLKVPNTFYHSASVTKEFKEIGLEITAGVRNLFDTKPPRVSTIGGGGLPSEIGPVVGTSQYDFIGRRAFLNVSKKF